MDKSFRHNFKNKNIDWYTTAFLVGSPILSAVGVYFAIKFEGWNLSPWIWAGVFYFLTVMAISGGYHRMFSHRALKAKPWVKLMYLLWGAASLEMSAMEWSRKHRRHHAKVDTDDDPYNINEGFYYAHMGWMMIPEEEKYQTGYPKDLQNDPLVAWQHKYYWPIAIGMSFVLPTLMGLAVGLPLSFFFIVGWLRVLTVHHVTYFINSLAHTWGSKPYSAEDTARDNHLLAFLTCGEGYHNYHHKFQADYRNGVNLTDWDPSKWFLYCLHKIGGVTELRRTPEAEILKARMAADQKVLMSKFDFNRIENVSAFQQQSRELAEMLSNLNLDLSKIDLSSLETLRDKVYQAQKKLQNMKAMYAEKKVAWKSGQKEKLSQFKKSLKLAKLEVELARREWQNYIESLTVKASLLSLPKP